MVESQHGPFLPDGKGADIQEGGDPPVLLRPAIPPPRRGEVEVETQSGGSRSLCSSLILFVSFSYVFISYVFTSSGVLVVGFCTIAISSSFVMHTRFLLFLVSFSSSTAFDCSASLLSVSSLSPLVYLHAILSFSSVVHVSVFFLLFSLCCVSVKSPVSFLFPFFLTAGFCGVYWLSLLTFFAFVSFPLSFHWFLSVVLWS